MIELSIQIKSLIFSFFYGILFSILLNINYKYIYDGPLFYRIAITFLFVLNNVLLYFIIIKILNDGIIHLYFIIMLILGFFTVNVNLKKLKFEKLKR